jgi:hypothetical protein
LLRSLSMNHPPRLAHLATRTVLIARLAPTYAKAHNLDDEEAIDRLGAALTPSLVDQLLAATWVGLRAASKKPDDAALLDKVAKSLADRPQRPGRTASVTSGWSAFLILADLEAGTASETARRALESEDGKRLAREGLAEVGRFMAAELTRG